MLIHSFIDDYFVDASKLDFTLKEDSVIVKDVPEMANIKMGLVCLLHLCSVRLVCAKQLVEEACFQAAPDLIGSLDDPDDCFEFPGSQP